MRLFIDTEFLETPQGLRFISAGFVSDDGRELYMEFPAAEVQRLPRHGLTHFVRSHVLAQLGRVPDGSVPWEAMPKLFADWLHGFSVDEVEVIYDFHADYSLVEELVARLESPLVVRLLPSHVGYLLADETGIDAANIAWEQVAKHRQLQRHHALADALSLQARFRAVHGSDIDAAPTDAPRKRT